jgi:DNA-directed RNA polymerase subunit RPC12/RpoP
MGKFIPDLFDVRQSFSHGRTTPVIVEKIKRPAGMRCPRCGGKMKLMRGPKLTAVCPRGCEQESK